MYPRARRDGVTAVATENGSLVCVHASRATYELNRLATLVFQGADGTRSVGQIAALVGLRMRTELRPEVAFAALDALADAGLLEARVARPAGMSRRRLMSGLGLAAAAMISLLPLKAPADDHAALPAPAAAQKAGARPRGDRKKKQRRPARPARKRAEQGSKRRPRARRRG